MTAEDDPFLRELSSRRSAIAGSGGEGSREALPRGRTTTRGRRSRGPEVTSPRPDPKPGSRRRPGPPPAAPARRARHAKGPGAHSAPRPGASRHRAPRQYPTSGLFPKRRARRRKPRPFLLELPGIVLTALVISIMIKTFLVQAFYIPSGSMENTLLVNDRVLVNKLVDKPDEVHRGDVVVFRDPGGWLDDGLTGDSGGLGARLRSVLVFVGLAPAVGDEDLIKRVIGVGGDRVRCCNSKGELTVNNVALTEPYVFPGNEPSTVTFDVRVPTGRLWVMGDHRGASEDSRAHHRQPGSSGFVPVSDVIGRAFAIVWPVTRMGGLGSPETFQQPRLQNAQP